MSSRNVKLTSEERTRAPALYAALMQGKAAIDAGERSCAAVEKLIRDRLVGVGEIVYVNCVDAESLQPMQRLKGDIRLIASLRLGVVPLVDNVGARAD
jgi:pantoate--beta-alanine ligase